MTTSTFIQNQIDRQHRLRSDKDRLVRAAKRLFRVGHQLPRGWFRLEVGHIADHMMRRAIFLTEQQ